jgi:hypothetical protein
VALRVTPVRLALLRAAAAEPRSWVYRCVDYDTKETVAYLERPGEGELLVTKRVEEQVKAGWLCEGPVTGPGLSARRAMLVTDAGREVLAAAETTRG